MKPTYFCLCMTFLLTSCMPLKRAKVQKTDLPALGLLGKYDKSLLNKNFQQLGPPSIVKPIAVAVSEVPFTKSQFKVYSNMKAQKEEQVSIQYIDSLPVKPKYYRLEIKDKIGLTSILNNAENDESRAYLTKDATCKIVTGISYYAHPMETELAGGMKNLFLTNNDKGILQLKQIIGKKGTVISIPESEIFAYELTGFCWGEDIYGNAQIETLNENGSCPEGTEKNAQKLGDLNAFLKL